MTVHLARERRKDKDNKDTLPMSDAGVPCIQEHDNWVRASLDLERQRHSLEELAVFEREVEVRLKAMGSEGCSQQKQETGDLQGLSVHSSEPRLLMDTDLREDDNFAMHSNRGRHRQKHDDRCILPHSVLVARSVSRAEFIANPKAMEAYWKEWENLEKKSVWRWETLREWDDVAAEAREGNKEVHFGYMLGIRVEKGSEFPEDDKRR